MICNNLHENLIHGRTSEKAPAIFKDTENYIGDGENIGNDVNKIGREVCYKIVYNADQV